MREIIMTQRQVKHLSLLFCFFAGLFWVAAYRFWRGPRPAAVLVKPEVVTGPRFASPEEVLAALTHENVDVRRAAWGRLLLRPGAHLTYYDYERDANYPERPDRAQLRYLNFDSGPAPEALLTFVRLEYPLAIVLRQDGDGWVCAGTFSAWLRYEEYPYDNWLETPPAPTPGQHALLLRESGGDAQSYTRTARLWRLHDGQFREVATLEEESLSPNDRPGPDWDSVKKHCVSSAAFATGAIDLATRCQLVKLSGPVRSHRYLSATDGVWHTAPGHWRHRTKTAWQTLLAENSRLVWDEARGEFRPQR
jgi:hypothetical protein